MEILTTILFLLKGLLAAYNNDTAEHDLLHQVELPVFKSSICDNIYNKTITPRMLCAGYENGDNGNVKGICDGDFGGPLVCKRKLFGIASYTKADEPCGRNPSVFARITSIRKWIKDISGIQPE